MHCVLFTNVFMTYALVAKGGRERERERERFVAHHLCHKFRMNISHVIRKGKSYKRYMHAHIFSTEY